MMMTCSVQRLLDARKISVNEESLEVKSDLMLRQPVNRYTLLINRLEVFALRIPSNQSRLPNPLSAWAWVTCEFFTFWRQSHERRVLVIRPIRCQRLPIPKSWSLSASD
ncbi:unnamed protein product [Prunus brigantina]